MNIIREPVNKIHTGIAKERALKIIDLIKTKTGLKSINSNRAANTEPIVPRMIVKAAAVTAFVIFFHFLKGIVYYRHAWRAM